MPYPRDAEVMLTRNKTTYGETAVIKCREGYKSSGVGSPTVSCLEDGRWEKWSDCVPIGGSTDWQYTYTCSFLKT